MSSEVDYTIANLLRTSIPSVGTLHRFTLETTWDNPTRVYLAHLMYANTTRAVGKKMAEEREDCLGGRE